MSFEIVSERPLTDEEIGLLNKATVLFGTGHDRRELLKLLGLSGAVVVASFVSVRPARALVPVIVQAVLVAGRIFLRSAIPATITFFNSSSRALSGDIGVQYIDSDGLIADQDLIGLDVSAKSKLTVSHDDFKAKKVGESQYKAYAEDSSKTDKFEVLQSQ